MHQRRKRRCVCCLEAHSESFIRVKQEEFMYDLNSNHHALILLGPGFDETYALALAGSLRASGLAVVIVGINSAIIRSRHGLTITPDCSLAELDWQRPFSLIVLSAGPQYVASLDVDPRFHRLLNTTITAGGFLAPTPYTGPFVARAHMAKQVPPMQLISICAEGIDCFVQHLTKITQEHALTVKV